MQESRVGPPVDGLTVVEVDGEVSIFNPATGVAVLLNAPATDIWWLADGEHTLEEMTRLLAAAYRTAPEALAGEVTAVVDRLRREGLLPGGPPS